MEELGAVIGLCFVGFILGYFNVKLRWAILAAVAAAVLYFIRRIAVLSFLAYFAPETQAFIIILVFFIFFEFAFSTLLTYLIGSFFRLKPFKEVKT